jgi:lysyl-tRNA synthetase class 2
LKYEIEKELFSRYPGFSRAVVVAKNVDNSGENEELLEMLRKCEEDVRNDPSMALYKEHPRISSWREVFRGMGLNPNRFPPSIANLIKRTCGGKDLPFINKLVTIFNVISLKYITPCGGDDLNAVTGSVKLGMASGQEDYVPLGQPDKLEHPTEGEVIYYDTGNNDVFCRGWCWKNGDRSKIMPDTANVAINIEGLPPVSRRELESMAGELASMVEKYCGGSTEVHLLNEDEPSFETDL